MIAVKKKKGAISAQIHSLTGLWKVLFAHTNLKIQAIKVVAHLCSGIGVMGKKPSGATDIHSQRQAHTKKSKWDAFGNLTFTELWRFIWPCFL